MGLDISLYKLTKDTSNERFIANAFLRKTFKSYVQSVAVEFEEYETKIGWKWKVTQYSDDIIHTFIDTRHDLYSAYKWMNKFWHKVYFKSAEELFNSRLFKSFERKILPKITELGWDQLYHFYASGNETHYFNLNNAKDFIESLVEIKIVNPTIVTKDVPCIFAEEIGYQRKGANRQFYVDKMWDSGKPIIALATLLEHRDKYFSDSNFQENIVDKFIEGETFVLYH